jgi:hypothetical protein
VYIEDPAVDGTVNATAVEMRGSASCPDCPPSETAFGYCHSGSTFIPSSAVSVGWANRSTGASGAADVGISGSCSCFFSHCTFSYHRRWSATVPLAIGANAIVVTATDTLGGSDTDTLNMTRIPPPPAAAAAASGSGEVTVTWGDVAGATAYQLYWSTSRDLTTSDGTKIANVSSPYVHTGLTDDVTYYYVVTAEAAGFESFASQVVSATAGWPIEDVAGTTSTTDQRDVAIAADPTGKAHLHFSYDESIGTASLQYNRYATNAAGGWPALAVAQPKSVGAGLALASDGTVHVSYLDFPGLRHAVLDAGAWVAETVDAQGTCVAAIALDGAGHTHLAYHAGTTTAKELRYATNASGAWAQTVLHVFNTIGCGLAGREVSIAVDAAGAAHVAFAGGDYPDSGLRYATNASGAWTSAIVDAVSVHQVSAAAFAGKAHIAYADNLYRVRYATNASGAWAIEDIQAGGSSHPSLALDAAGKAHVAYFNSQFRELRYAENVAGPWQQTVIAVTGIAPPNSATNTAVAVDSLGKAHVGAFFGGGRLKYATNRQ